MRSLEVSARAAWSRMLRCVSSIWQPILGDMGFLFALGFIGGAIGKKIESLLIAAGASIARGSQGMEGVQIATQDSALLWQGLWLHVLFVIVVYVLFCVFGVIGWRWALRGDYECVFSLYFKRFALLHAFLIPCAVLVDVLGFWAEYEGLVVEGSGLSLVLRGVYLLLLMCLVAVSVMGSVHVVRYSAWQGLRKAISGLGSPRRSWAFFGVVLCGFVIINALIGILSMASAGGGLIIGIGLLFPYLAFVRLFAVEVFA